MAVHSNTFGGLQLSGDDAKKFRSQIRSGRASKAARTSVANGLDAAAKLIAQGYVKIDKVGL